MNLLGPFGQPRHRLGPSLGADGAADYTDNGVRPVAGTILIWEGFCISESQGPSTLGPAHAIGFTRGDSRDASNVLQDFLQWGLARGLKAELLI